MLKVAQAFLAIVLGVLTALIILTYTEDADGAIPATGSFVHFQMISTDTNLNDGSVDVLLAVRSATDMPVPGVSVVLGLCQSHIGFPFQLASRTRRLSPAYETLRAFNDGRNLEWKMFSAPANTEPYHVLRLKLALPPKGGPDYCITGAASTPYDHGASMFYTLNWWLGMK